MFLRLWLFLVLVCVGALAPSCACARVAETRTWDFFATSTESRQENAPQVADWHQANPLFNYETALGYAQAAETLPVRILRPGGGNLIYGEIPGVGKISGAITGETLWIDNVAVNEGARLQGNSIRLYEALLNEAPATKVIRGEPGGVNLEVLKRTGDINLTPRARALNQLGFTKHEYDAANGVMSSTRP